MKLNTASQVISLARKLEEDGADLYESVAGQYPKDRDVLLGFAKENKKNITRVERAYYSAITDALEGGFAFDLDPDDYEIKPDVSRNMAYADIINTAIKMEEKTARFYDKAAEQAKPLMADVPRAFSNMARLRNDRREKLADLRDIGNKVK
jgi:rubrerythrin